MVGINPFITKLAVPNPLAIGTISAALAQMQIKTVLIVVARENHVRVFAPVSERRILGICVILPRTEVLRTFKQKLFEIV